MTYALDPIKLGEMACRDVLAMAKRHGCEILDRYTFRASIRCEPVERAIWNARMRQLV